MESKDTLIQTSVWEKNGYIWFQYAICWSSYLHIQIDINCLTISLYGIALTSDITGDEISILLGFFFYCRIKTCFKDKSIKWKYLYLLVLIFVVSTKCIDPWVLEFMVSNTTGNNQWENCISLDFNFHGLSEPRNPWKLKLHD